MRIITTGGMGFICKSFIKLALDSGHKIYDIDKVTHVADEDYYLNTFTFRKKYRGKHFFEKADINDVDKLPPSDVIVHMAAESDVDSSIGDNEQFLKTNIMGTRNLLEVVRMMPKYDRPLFVFISTDEVVGDSENMLDENSSLNPSSPYSSSKAAGELLVRAWHRTYELDYLIIRPSNNFGYSQFPTKLIPRTIMRFKNRQKAIIHGTGGYKRSWTHTNDTSRAILHLMRKRYKNDIFNITSGYELTNLEVIKKIFDCMKKSMIPNNFVNWVEFVENRKGQDVRYASDNSKLLSTGFEFKYNFDKEIKKIIKKKEVDWNVSQGKK